MERLCAELAYIDAADTDKLYQGSQPVHFDAIELAQKSTPLPGGMARYETLCAAGNGLDVAMLFPSSIYNSARPGEGRRMPENRKALLAHAA